MAIIIQKINLDVNKPNLFQTIVAKQKDNDSRFLNVTLIGNNVKIEILPTSTVTINAKRNEDESKKFAGKVNDDGTATVPLTYWMLEKAGEVKADVSVIDADGRKLTTTNFTIIVEQASCEDDDITEDENYDILVKLIEDVKSLNPASVDQHYDPTSENAQSGIAVEEALKPVEEGLTEKINTVGEQVSELKSDLDEILNDGKNLFDSSKIADGYYVNQNTGILVANVSFKSSDYISIIPSTSYTISVKSLSVGTTAQIRYFQYDENKNPIASSGGINGSGKEITFVSDVSAKYVRFSYVVYSSEVMLEKGESATEYEEYRGKYINPEKIDSYKKYVDEQIKTLDDKVKEDLTEEINTALEQAKASGEFDGADGKDGANGTNGKDGTSVTVKSVSESTADGGNNVVTFSDGKTLTVKNGSKGSKGDKGATGSKGADGKTPVKGTDYFTEADKKEMVESVVESIDGIPDYWQTALQDGANEIRQAMEIAGRNKSAFFFYSDAHWDYGSRMSPKLLKYLYKHTAINKTFFGGDIVNSESTDRDVMKYLYEWREMLRDLPNHHSVVGNHDDGNATNNLFSTNYIYSYLLAAEETPQVVQGSDMYYYIDEPCEKTRYLFLDTAYKGLDDEQKAFITDTLKSTPSGWHIVVVAHIWYMPDYNQYNARPVPLTGLSTDAVTLTTILDNYNSRTGEFADCEGWVEFCIGGHIHYDYDATTSTGIPIILVETDSQHIRGTYSYTAGTTTEASVNGIIADYENHKIYVVRIGRGESREITVTNYIVSYTNLLQTAEVGYEANQEYSTSSFNQRASSGGFDLTGFIPLTDGDTFYLKNFVMPNGHTTWRNCGVYLFNSDKSWKGNFTMSTSDATGSTFKPIYGDDGNLIQFTVPSGVTGCYMRINCTQIDDTSILTRNEPIE